MILIFYQFFSASLIFLTFNAISTQKAKLHFFPVNTEVTTWNSANNSNHFELTSLSLFLITNAIC